MKKSLLIALLLLSAQAKSNSICKGTCMLRDDQSNVTLDTTTWTFKRCNEAYHSGFMIHKTVGIYHIQINGEPGEMNSIVLADNETNHRAEFGTSWQPFWTLKEFSPRVMLQSSTRSATLFCRTEVVE